MILSHSEFELTPLTPVLVSSQPIANKDIHQSSIEPVESLENGTNLWNRLNHLKKAHVLIFIMRFLHRGYDVIGFNVFPRI